MSSLVLKDGNIENKDQFFGTRCYICSNLKNLLDLKWGTIYSLKINYDYVLGTKTTSLNYPKPFRSDIGLYTIPNIKNYKNVIREFLKN